MQQDMYEIVDDEELAQLRDIVVAQAMFVLGVRFHLI